MARRIATLISAVMLWILAALLLAGSAGFLFAALVHPLGSEGWRTSATVGAGLILAGALVTGIGAWVVGAGAGHAPDDTTSLDHDTMWLGEVRGREPRGSSRGWA